MRSRKINKDIRIILTYHSMKGISMNLEMSETLFKIEMLAILKDPDFVSVAGYEKDGHVKRSKATTNFHRR